MKQLYKRAKFDIGLVAQALNNTNATGRYFKMDMWRKLIAILNGGAMAATKTTTIEILQATDIEGTGAKGIPSTAGQTATAEITANEKVTEATIALAAAAATDKVEVNGITYTMAAATDATKKEFADAAGLVACINHATYGVENVIASDSGTTVTVRSGDGVTTLTVTGTNVAGTVTVATTQAQAFVEVDVGSLDLENGFEYVAVKVTTTANSVVSAELIRGDGRFEPEQSVGASAVV
jgi:hypothetical protein